jgi:hypothetical protein
MSTATPDQSRVQYTVKTIEALCHLIQSSVCSQETREVIVEHCGEMLSLMWDVEFKAIHEGEKDEVKELACMNSWPR